MDLTFQVPMQYCSLQHWTLLLSPVTSTIGYCFCFGLIPSFFLELFLHRSPVAYLTHSDLGSSSFSNLSFCFFILFMGSTRTLYTKAKPSPLSWALLHRISLCYLHYQDTSNLRHTFSHTCDLDTSQTLHTIIKATYYLPCTVASA